MGFPIRSCNFQNGDDTKHCRCVELSCVQIPQSEVGCQHTYSFLPVAPSPGSQKLKGGTRVGQGIMIIVCTGMAAEHLQGLYGLQHWYRPSILQECSKLVRWLWGTVAYSFLVIQGEFTWSAQIKCQITEYLDMQTWLKYTRTGITDCSH